MKAKRKRIGGREKERKECFYWMDGVRKEPFDRGEMVSYGFIMRSFHSLYLFTRLRSRAIKHRAIARADGRRGDTKNSFKLSDGTREHRIRRQSEDRRRWPIPSNLLIRYWNRSEMQQRIHPWLRCSCSLIGTLSTLLDYRANLRYSRLRPLSFARRSARRVLNRPLTHRNKLARRTGQKEKKRTEKG